MTVMPIYYILGLTLTFGTPPNFIAEVTALLHTMWGPHRQLFNIDKAKVLTGKLNRIGFSSPWVKNLLGHIYFSLSQALCVNHAQLVLTNHTFHSALRSIRSAMAMPTGIRQHAFHMGNMACTTNHCRLPQYIDCNTVHDLCLIKHAIFQEAIPKSCPIACLILHTPIGIACSNSSLHAAGGYCNFATLWWYLEWPQEVQAHTIQHTTGCNSTPHSSSPCLVATSTFTNLPVPHPIFLRECNNTQGEAWLKKGCTISLIRHALTHLQAALLLDNNIRYHFGRVDTKSNVIANGISCIPSKTS